MRIEVELGDEVVADHRRAHARPHVLLIERALLRIAFDHYDARADLLQVRRQRCAEAHLTRIRQSLVLRTFRFRLEQSIRREPHALHAAVAAIGQRPVPVVRR